MMSHYSIRRKKYAYFSHLSSDHTQIERHEANRSCLDLFKHSSSTPSHGVKMKKSIVIAGTLIIALGCTLFRFLKNDPNALWDIVHDGCTWEQQTQGKPTPCITVNLREGWAVLKDEVSKTQVLLIPTKRVTGIEDPQIVADNAPNYWEAAWDARVYVQQRAQRILQPDDIALAINSKEARSQNQLHIHVDCLRTAVRNQLRLAQARISRSWSDMTVDGAAYRVRTLSLEELRVDNIFVLIAKQLLPGEEMDRETVVVAGAPLPGTEGGFDILVGRTGVGRNTGSGEDLEDHTCAIAREYSAVISVGRHDRCYGASCSIGPTTD
jgi:CDP-diacylglycerol pyrophosphatase